MSASVGIKWFLPEVHAAEARHWRNGPDELHTPAFFFDLEIDNILWKKVRSAEITRAEAELIQSQLPTLPTERHIEVPLLAAAFDLADRTQRTVYDCLYLALAERLGGRMVTADLRLCNSLAGTPWATRLPIRATSAACLTVRSTAPGWAYQRMRRPVSGSRRTTEDPNTNCQRSSRAATCGLCSNPDYSPRRLGVACGHNPTE